MKLRVKLIAVASRRGRASGAGGETLIDVTEGATPDDALVALDLPSEETYVTLVNGEVVPPGARAGVHLGEEDLLTVFPPLKGG